MQLGVFVANKVSYRYELIEIIHIYSIEKIQENNNAHNTKENNSKSQ